MKLCKKTLEKLRTIINGDETDDYRTGPKLIEFFNNLGFKDNYYKGFPSRWMYTDSKLEQINGTPELDKCIKEIFTVNNYINRIEYLDSLLEDFNQYLLFDKWKVIRENEKISLYRLGKIIIPTKRGDSSDLEDKFLKMEFNVSINDIGLENFLTTLLNNRIKEAEDNTKNGNTISAIIMIGSIMEGILFGVATLFPSTFNKAQSAPKDKNGIIKKFYEWTLNDFINTAFEIGMVREDVKKFSHVVRDFRNYIHPYQQLCTRFDPDRNTALICLQVLKALVFQIEQYKIWYNGNERE